MFFFLACSCFFCFSVEAQEEAGSDSQFSVGLGYGVSWSEYKGVSTDTSVIPIISYEGERLFLHGLTGGIYLLKNDNHKFYLNVSYMPQSFDASDSSEWAMRRLDDRKSTMMGGAGYKLTSDLGTVKIEAQFDLLNENKGMIVDASYAYPIYISSLTLTPKGGVIWANDKFNDYYYGISQKESQKSGLREYQADGDFSPYLGLGANLNINDSWNVFLSGQAVFLGDEITDSPMVGRDIKYSCGGGLSYSF